MPDWLFYTLLVCYGIWSMVEVVFFYLCVEENVYRQKFGMNRVRYNMTSKIQTMLWIICTIMLICYWITGGK